MAQTAVATHLPVHSTTGQSNKSNPRHFWDPLAYFFVLDWYKLPERHILTKRDNLRWFGDLLRPLAEAGAIVAQLEDASGLIVGYGPDFKPPSDLPPRTLHDGPTSAASATESNLVSYINATEDVKTTYLRGRPYWYIFLVARNPDLSNKSAPVSPALVEPFMRSAREFNMPLWLEATTESSRDIYILLGLRVVEDVRLGVGLVNVMGKPDRQGEGISIWPMVYEP